MNRSLAFRMRRSAGIISPAARWTMSPTTSSSIGRSCFTPPRSTQAVVWIMAVSLSATLPLRVSCTKRSAPDTATITPMIPTVIKFFSPGSASRMSVTTDTAANSSKTSEKGSAKASSSRRAAGLRLVCTIRLAPQRSRAASACASLSPAGVLCSRASSRSSRSAAARRRPACTARILAGRLPARFLLNIFMSVPPIRSVMNGKRYSACGRPAPP